MYYTWLDIEWKIKSERKSWPLCWVSVDVYPDELVVNYKPNNNYEDESIQYLNDLFTHSFNKDNRTISLQLIDNCLNVVFEEIVEEIDKRPLPLFKNSVYQENGIPDTNSDPLPIPVIAFHSYKGGVGRTLSLIALLRELSRRNKNFKALVVDADMEAPGLTLMTKNHGFPAENRISYADILSVIHDSESEFLFKDAVQIVAKSMVNSLITVATPDINVNHYFIPAYRFDYQRLDNFIHPETIVSMPERAFIIQKFLSALGKSLGADIVLIDLRAGLSELSAPLLFDPRVKRVFVTTTSNQSVKGMKFILEKIFASSFPQKELIKNEEIVNMTILLTMIPNGFNEEKQNEIIDDLLDVVPKNTSPENIDDENDKTLSDIIIESRFSDGLIHLEDLEQINISLQGTYTAQASEILAKRLDVLGKSCEKISPKFEEPYRKKIIDKVHDIASKEVTAEGHSSVQIMTTGSLEKLCRAYQENVPRVVILGAKGSGKTYIYKQLLGDKHWEKFIDKILVKQTKNPQILVVPVLSTINRSGMTELLEVCFSNINKELHIEMGMSILSDNENILQRASEESQTQSDWFDTWSNVLLNSLSKRKYNSFDELDAQLASIGKKIVFIIDGLEDVFTDTIHSKGNKMAIKILCQDIVNKLVEYKNIGIILFVRNDITKNSITINYEQFERQYNDYALKWSQDEALRLVIWILAQAKFRGYEKNIDIPRLSSSSFDDYLVPFWGLKLGGDSSNEAFSTSWIITALSDLRKQIQARDIIRFLEAVTSNCTKDTHYNDRILLPPDIKKAIGPCSEKKLEEINKEIPGLEQIFTKLKNPGAYMGKELPIKAENMNMILSREDRLQLEEQGFLILVKNDYYFPEIIRHALGYKYAHGSRPRVLALLSKK